MMNNEPTLDLSLSLTEVVALLNALDMWRRHPTRDELIGVERFAAGLRNWLEVQAKTMAIRPRRR
jgi:hypothetical protein